MNLAKMNMYMYMHVVKPMTSRLFQDRRLDPDRGGVRGRVQRARPPWAAGGRAGGHVGDGRRLLRGVRLAHRAQRRLDVRHERRQQVQQLAQLHSRLLDSGRRRYSGTVLHAREPQVPAAGQ